MRELERYRKVRSRDWVASQDEGLPKKRAAKGASSAAAVNPASSSSSDAAAAAAVGDDSSALPPEATLDYKDFWEGLDQLLALHYSDPKVRKAIAQAFDEIHYSGLRGMDIEDCDDIAHMKQREVQ